MANHTIVEVVKPIFKDIFPANDLQSSVEKAVDETLKPDEQEELAAKYRKLSQGFRAGRVPESDLKKFLQETYLNFSIIWAEAFIRMRMKDTLRAGAAASTVIATSWVVSILAKPVEDVLCISVEGFNEAVVICSVIGFIAHSVVARVMPESYLRARSGILSTYVSLNPVVKLHLCNTCIANGQVLSESPRLARLNLNRTRAINGVLS